MNYRTTQMGRATTLLLSMLLMFAISPIFAQEAEKQAATVEVDEVIVVTTAKLSDIWFQRMLQASAEVLSLNHSQISAQATGEVLSIEVETGEVVEKGAVLVRLDCRQSELSQAVLNDAHKLALKEYQRSKSLGKKNAIAEQQLTQVTSALEQARIRKKQAQLAVEHCLITAPFSGVVTERQIQLGAVAVPGSSILKLLQIDAVEVEARLNSDELKSMQETAQIAFRSGGQSYPLRLRSVIPVIDSISNKRIVRLSIEGEPPFPGAPGDVVWRAPGWYLPVSLIVERQGTLGCFIKEEDVGRFVPLSDAMLGHPARVDHVFDQADQIQVVVEGRYRIENGRRIRTATAGE